ncbi:unnamed protein product [Allacma fusca]|uniref:Gustatory receptor n=1 Tax=Allacma fusca TaxID=39272 RepID=A0A8J2J3N1_9HEXA|nr:unnamed protein product [Allacma fusca]
MVVITTSKGMKSLPNWLVKIAIASGLWPFQKNEIKELRFKWISLQFVASFLFIVTGLVINTIMVIFRYKAYHGTVFYLTMSSDHIGPSETFGRITSFVIITFGINILRLVHILKRRSIVTFWNKLVNSFSTLNESSETVATDLEWLKRVNLGLAIFFLLELALLMLRSVFEFVRLSKYHLATDTDQQEILRHTFYTFWEMLEKLFMRNYYLLYYVMVSSICLGLVKLRLEVEKETFVGKLYLKDFSQIEIWGKMKGDEETNAVRILGHLDTWKRIVDEFNSTFAFPVLFCGIQLGALILTQIFIVAVHLTDKNINTLRYSFVIEISLDTWTLFLVCMAGNNMTVNVLKLARKLEKISVERLSKDTRERLRHSIKRMHAKPMEIRPGNFITFNARLVTSMIAGSISYLLVMVQFNSSNSCNED